MAMFKSKMISMNTSRWIFLSVLISPPFPVEFGPLEADFELELDAPKAAHHGLDGLAIAPPVDQDFGDEQSILHFEIEEIGVT